MVLEADHWVIARQDNSFVALYSHQYIAWAEDPRWSIIKTSEPLNNNPTNSQWFCRARINSLRLWKCLDLSCWWPGEVQQLWLFAGTILKSIVEVALSWNMFFLESFIVKKYRNIWWFSWVGSFQVSTLLFSQKSTFFHIHKFIRWLFSPYFEDLCQLDFQLDVLNVPSF